MELILFMTFYLGSFTETREKIFILTDFIS